MHPSLPPNAVDAAALRRLRSRQAQAVAAPWLHQEVARRMAERLQVIRQVPHNWLDWGGFAGGGRAAVQTTWPASRCTVVEATPALAERSRQALRGPWWTGHRAQAQVLDEVSVPAGGAGMVWANMALHTSADPPALLSRWHHALAVDGLLMFSTFGPDTLAELRALYAEQGWPAPHPPFTDMHDIGDQLVHSGFADPVMDQEILHLNWSSPEALLAELRPLGANLGSARPAGLRTPRWRQCLVDALSKRADTRGRIPLRFEIIYGHAYRAAPRAARSETSVVTLDSVRASLRQRRQPGGGA